MALPVAHWAVALGTTRSRDPWLLAFLGLLSIAPDFDFLLVWGLQLSPSLYHRTWSHSLLFFAVLAGLWRWLRPRRLQGISPTLFLAVAASHSLLDLLCTADAADHGIMLFWPVSQVRLGWPVLVPIYRLLAESPFSVTGALWFTGLELLLALPLCYTVRALRESLYNVMRQDLHPPQGG